MFQTIEEGVRVYREAVREHLKISTEVDGLERADRGDDYRGVVDWSTDAYNAYHQRTARISGMAAALGLSDDEQEEIAKEEKQS